MRPVAEALCQMAVEFNSRGNVSMASLLNESGYAMAPAPLTEIERVLRANPDLIDSWVRYSEDQRSSSGWYLAPADTKCHAEAGWRVGSILASGAHVPDQIFSDRFAACAAFVKALADQLNR